MIKKIIFYSVAVIIIFALVTRAFLPFLLFHFVAKKLNQIPDYVAHIESVGVSAYQGSYRINHLELLKKSTAIPVPFFSADTIEFKLQWRELLQGHLVAEVRVIKPVLNFVIDPQGKDEQLSINDQWRTIVTQLYPLPFNRITIHNGEAYFRSYKGKPPFEVHLKNIESELNNLRQVKDTPTSLFAHLQATAKAMDGAGVKLDMQFNPFIKQPTFLLKAGLSGMKISAANNLLQHYTKVKVTEGWFSVYMEAAAAKGNIKGYVKPLFKNLQVTPPNEKVDNPIEYLYKGAVQLLTKILENPKQKTVATKIKIRGNIKDPSTNLFSIIGYLLRHAFIQALLPGIDHSIKMQDVVVS
jgi:hypothetical protein